MVGRSARRYACVPSTDVDPLDGGGSRDVRERVNRMKVGIARRFSATTSKSLVADLRQILDPQYVARAREVASRMTKPEASVTKAADLLEDVIRVRRIG